MLERKSLARANFRSKVKHSISYSVPYNTAQESSKIDVTRERGFTDTVQSNISLVHTDRK